MSPAWFPLALGLYLVGGLAGLATAHRPRLALRLGAAGAVLGAGAGTVAAVAALLGRPVPSVALPWAVPGGALRLAVDPLSAAFLLPVFVLSALCAVYAVGYLDGFAKRRWLGAQVFFLNLLAAAMAVVVTARNGLLFLAAWETMSLASLFLVSFEHERTDVQEASRVYLIATHLGAALLMVFFTLLARDTGTFDLDRVPAGALGAGQAAALFALALAGFGAKAGLWPLHVWLPKAHPAAPSHVSALMSGAMIKTGLYGICRTLWLLGPPPLSWGLVLLALGAVSGLLGILAALAQRDLKALLAYSSAENVGIVLLGLGVGVVGSAAGRPLVAAAGYAGALLHVWNHGLMKGLLFLAAGSAVHATGTRDLERLGGLLRRMPWTGTAFLAGAAAIAGLPPLNGLVGEWLIYGGLFRAGAGVPGLAGLAALSAAAALALIGGLALATFARAAGIAFLGEPRSDAARGAREGGRAMRVPLAVLATLCLAIGLAPGAAAALLRGACTVLAPGAGAAFSTLAGWTAPLARVGYLSAGLLATAAALLAVRARLLAHRPTGVAPTWDCGYAAPTVRMQYTGGSFAAPLIGVFAPLVATETRLEPPRGYFPRGGALSRRPRDAAEEALWRPLFAGAARGLGALRFLQGGRLQHYLLFLLVALVALLGWALLPA